MLRLKLMTHLKTMPVSLLLSIAHRHFAVATSPVQTPYYPISHPYLRISIAYYFLISGFEPLYLNLYSYLISSFVGYRELMNRAPRTQHNRVIIFKFCWYPYIRDSCCPLAAQGHIQHLLQRIRNMYIWHTHSCVRLRQCINGGVCRASGRIPPNRLLNRWGHQYCHYHPTIKAALESTFT